MGGATAEKPAGEGEKNAREESFNKFFKKDDSIKDIDAEALRSRIRKKEILEEYDKNPKKFFEGIRKNARKLEENWRLFSDKEISGVDAFKAVVEIACEKGLIHTDAIVDEMLKTHNAYHRVVDSANSEWKRYHGFPADKLGWFLGVINSEYPVSFKPRGLIRNRDDPFRPKEFLQELSAEVKMAYSIVGLSVAGVELDLAARIGSVNTELGIETAKALLKAESADTKSKISPAVLQSVYNNIGALGKDDLERQLGTANKIICDHIGGLNPAISYIFELGEGSVKVWLGSKPDVVEGLYQIYENLKLETTRKFIEAVRTSEEMKAFRETFNAMKEEIFNFPMECYKMGGEWKFRIVPRIHKEESSINDEVKSQVNYEEVYVGSYTRNSLAVKDTIPEGDCAVLGEVLEGIPPKVRTYTRQVPTEYEDWERIERVRYEKTGVVGDVVFYRKSYITTTLKVPSKFREREERRISNPSYLVFLDVLTNTEPFFTNQVVGFFANTDIPLEERVKAIRKEMEDFKKKLGTQDRWFEFSIKHPDKPDYYKTRRIAQENNRGYYTSYPSHKLDKGAERRGDEITALETKLFNENMGLMRDIDDAELSQDDKRAIAEKLSKMHMHFNKCHSFKDSEGDGYLFINVAHVRNVKVNRVARKKEGEWYIEE